MDEHMCLLGHDKYLVWKIEIINNDVTCLLFYLLFILCSEMSSPRPPPPLQRSPPPSPPPASSHIPGLRTRGPPSHIAASQTSASHSYHIQQQLQGFQKLKAYFVEQFAVFLMIENRKA
jgi:hypothetical protein